MVYLHDLLTILKYLDYLIVNNVFEKKIITHYMFIIKTNSNIPYGINIEIF